MEKNDNVGERLNKILELSGKLREYIRPGDMEKE